MGQTISTLVFAVGLPIAVVVAMIVIVVRRGFQMNQLLADGIETTGTVAKKFKQGRSSRSIRTRYLRYQYTDQHGISHSHRSMVELSVYDAHELDSPIAVVYSESKPEVSAPKVLLEQVKEGKRRQAARRGGSPPAA